MAPNDKVLCSSAVDRTNSIYLDANSDRNRTEIEKEAWLNFSLLDIEEERRRRKKEISAALGCCSGKT